MDPEQPLKGVIHLQELGNDDPTISFLQPTNGFKRNKRCAWKNFATMVVGAFVLAMLAALSILFVIYRPQIADIIPIKEFTEEDNYTIAVRNYAVHATEVLPYLNSSRSICNEFYNFVCDGWTASAHLAPGRSRMTKSFSSVNSKNREVVEKIAKEDWPFVGTFYESCTNLDNRGNFTTIREDYDMLYNSLNITSMMRTIATLRTRGYTTVSSILFNFNVQLDLHNPQQKIVVLTQAGYTLPTPDYYNANDQLIDLQLYRQYIVSLFALTPNSISSSVADNIIEFERRLANVNIFSQTLEDSYNVYTWPQFRQRTANYVYAYILALGWLSDAAKQRAQIAHPAYFDQMRTIVTNTPFETIRNAAIYSLLRTAFPLMDYEYSEAAKALPRLIEGVSGTLSTVDAVSEECAEMTNNMFPVLVGHYFAKEAGMNEEFKRKALELTLLQKEAVFNRLEAVTWMDVSTKNSALHKLRSMDVNVVFPDSWEQVKRLERLLTVPLNTSTFMPNVMFMTRGYDRQNFDEFTLPPNKNDWAEIRIDLSKLEGWSKLNEDDVEVSKLEGLAQVNAFYNPQNNSINIPAGIWQPPFYFDEDWIKIPPAVNFGGIAPPLCHEMFHAFDNRGRLFDAHGSLSNWWQDSSAQEFSVRTQCIVDFYNAMHSESGYPINGLSNLGEAIADIGGMRAAYDAYKEFLNEFPAEELSDMTSAIVAAYQGYTHEQLFFITYGQLWCEVETPAEELEQIRSDPHTPAHQRVLGVYANTPEFAAAFNCPLGSNYAPINACEVF